MLIGPVLVLLLVLLFYKRDVNPAGAVWVPPHLRVPQAPSPSPTPTTSPDPMDLDEVFRRPAG